MTPSEIHAWRKQKRDALLVMRQSCDAQLRRQRGRAACEQLMQLDVLRKVRTLGIYWPIRAEIDLRGAAATLADAGMILAMPVVARRSAPLEFWRWDPGMAMQRGFWNIPIPATRRLVTPDAVLAPCIGFDASLYRLGYGGGYFDRTLAATAPQPLAIGIAYCESQLPTIHPLPHDIPMNVIVTDAGVLRAPLPH